ncbi:helix-turn-helix transcriptional regulator [Streptomyces sp. CNQ085]|uniref:helix-turn-helix transcriptional regulator n=1 Tax=Streptomyces sp. CNQ085 TaxID=2886944 RepID=UPI001F50E1E6|nr:helix-turn-helix transcriptional regulator [Streptomyces sp. CNQ085]MCI0384742.1 helix-turn-helix transcriptional regulator [Streptomyces sp. CNQ085]
MSADSDDAAETGTEARQVYTQLVGTLRSNRATWAPPPEEVPGEVRNWLAERRLLGPEFHGVSSPERALRELLGEQRARLRSAAEAMERNLRAVDDVLDLLPEFRVSGHESVEVEFIEDRDRLRRRLDEFEPVGRREVLCMRTTFPGPEVLEVSLGHDRRVLAQGTEMRMLATVGATRAPGVAAYLDALREAGARVRVAAALPLYLHVVDRTVALMPAGDDPLGGDGDVLLRNPRIALCFAQVFEHEWDVARPYPGGEGRTGRAAGPRPADEYTEQEREILALLATGTKDESIARRLGCSERTLRRMMTRITEKLEAGSRFAAGVRAARLGLID